MIPYTYIHDVQQEYVLLGAQSFLETLHAKKQSINQLPLVSQSINQSVNQSISQSIDYSVHQATKHEP